MFNILDIIGEIGGIFESLGYIFTILLVGYPHFSFVMKAMEKLYVAKTSQEGVIEKHEQRMTKKDDKKVKFKILKVVQKKENADQIYPIRFNSATKL